MLISDLWGISFHAVVIFGLGKNLLFKSVLERCESEMMLDVNLQERQTTGCFAILLFVQRGFFNYFCWFPTLQLFLARVSQLGGLEHRAVGMSQNLVGTSLSGLMGMICS